MRRTAYAGSFIHPWMVSLKDLPWPMSLSTRPKQSAVPWVKGNASRPSMVSCRINDDGCEDAGCELEGGREGEISEGSAGGMGWK